MNERDDKLAEEYIHKGVLIPMKKIFPLFLAVILLLLSLLALSSCEQDETRIELETIEGYDGEVEITHEKGNSVIKFYIDQTQGYDVADLENIKVKFRYTRDEDHIFVRSTKLRGTVPEDARGNPEKQYFTVEIKDVEIPEDRHIYVVWAKATLDNTTLEDSEVVVDEPVLSIGQVVLLGVLGLVILCVLLFAGMSFLDEELVKFLIGAALVIPLIAVVIAYIVLGAVRGLILTGFFVVFLIIALLMFRAID